MRTGAKSTFLKVFLFGFLLFAMLGLVFTDVQGNFRTGVTKNDIAIIGGDKLTTIEFDRIFDMATQQYNISREKAYQAGLAGQVLTQEINSRLFTKEAKDLGLLMDDASVAKHVRTIISPLAEKEKISERDALKAALNRMGVSEATFVASVKSQMSSQELLKMVTSGVSAPKQMVDDALKYKYENRKAEYFKLGEADAGKIDPPSEDVLKKRYAEISSRFMTPETRTFAVLMLERKNLAGEVHVSEETVKKYYDDHIKDYTHPERRTISQINTTDEALAKSLRDKVVKSKDAKKAADGSNGLATFVRGTYAESDLASEISKPAFAAKEGSVTDPIKSPLGWHVLYIERVSPAYVVSYDDAKKTIGPQLVSEKASEAVYESANEADDMIAGGTPLAEVAAKFGLKETVFTDIDVTGANKMGQKQETTIPVFDKVVEHAFKLEEGEASQLIETPEGNFAIVELRHITPSAEKPYEQVKLSVELDWRQEKISKLLDEKAAKVIEQLKLGDSFSKVAADLGKTPVTTALLGRTADSKKENLPSGLVSALFSIDKSGGVTTTADGNSLYIIRLADRKVEIPKDAKKEDIESMATMLERSIQNDILEQYRSGLMAKYDVTIDNTMLEKLYAPKDNN